MNPFPVYSPSSGGSLRLPSLQLDLRIYVCQSFIWCVSEGGAKHHKSARCNLSFRALQEGSIPFLVKFYKPNKNTTIRILRRAPLLSLSRHHDFRKQSACLGDKTQLPLERSCFHSWPQIKVSLLFPMTFLRGLN